jgi:ABC-type transport system involved in cytochrome c biogenesis permease subunit
MTIHYSIEGNLIYVAMIMLAVGLVLSLLRKIKWLSAVVFGAFVVLLAGWIRRWIAVGHLPMQTMFEVFLTLAMVLFPIGVVARRVVGINDGWHGQAQLGRGDSWDIVADLILAFVILFPAGFVFSDQPQVLPPVLQSPLFGPHVLAYMLSYVLMAKAAMYATAGLIQKKSVGWQPPRQPQADEMDGRMYVEQSAYLLACLGFPLMCLGLMLGSVWGVFAWGDWWNWDPKELWSLACVLMYAFYFHWRHYFGQKFLRANCLLVILGFVFILITLLWVNFSRLFPGLHNYVG